MDIPVKCLPSKSQQKREENEYLREELRVDGLDLDMDDIDEKADSNLAASKKKIKTIIFFSLLHVLIRLRSYIFKNNGAWNFRRFSFF